MHDPLNCYQCVQRESDCIKLGERLKDGLESMFSATIAYGRQLKFKKIDRKHKDNMYASMEKENESISCIYTSINGHFCVVNDGRR
jgi:hypothetical protein